ncbi:MAG: Pyrrolo-quinoline quinone repeat-containing protein, partial [Planctomycetaceae bacterium]|nr:Pyrrolo-quinoline quinone repeat-containing protein [Planctomycetaceae bacterium]
MRLVTTPIVPVSKTHPALRSAFGCFCIWSILVFSLSTGGRASDSEKTKSKTPAANQKAAEGAKAATNWPSFRNGFDLLGIAESPLPEKLEQLWKFPTGEMVVSTAAIVDGRVYVASLSGKLFCLDLKTGEKIWSYRSIDDPDPKSFAPGFKASPTVTADTIYIGDEDGVFHALNRDSGKPKWEPFKTGAEIVSSATLYKDKVLFGSHDNILYCLNTSDGKLAWKFTTQGPVNCTPAIIGNRTFVTGCDEHLRVINIDN